MLGSKDPFVFLRSRYNQLVEKPHDPEQAEQSFSFRSGKRIAEIYAQLVEMKKQGKTLQGTENKFSPRQLAELVNLARNAFRRVLREATLDQPLTVKILDDILADLAVTRAGGFRQALMDTFWDIYKNGTDLDDEQSLRFYRLLTQ